MSAARTLTLGGDQALRLKRLSEGQGGMRRERIALQ